MRKTDRATPPGLPEQTPAPTSEDAQITGYACERVFSGIRELWGGSCCLA